MVRTASVSEGEVKLCATIEGVKQLGVNERTHRKRFVYPMTRLKV